MDIVFLAHFAGSPRHGMVYGQYYLANEWVRSGHRVTIIAARFAHTRDRQPQASGLVTEEFIDGIRYLWVWSPAYRPGGRAGRVLNIFSFTALTSVLPLRISRADVVICSSHHPFAIHPAKRLARKLEARLVFEVRDLWPRTLIELGGASERHPFIRAMQYCEDYAYRTADCVVSVLPGACDYMVQRGMDRAKFIYVPNGVTQDDGPVELGQLPEPYHATLDGLRREGDFVIGYAGRLGLANALDCLLDAVAACPDGTVCAAILGEGSHLPALRAQAQRLGIERRVAFLPPVPKTQVKDFLSRVDATFLGLQDRPLFRFGVSPTKLNDYMLAARPVVYAVGGPGSPVSESDCGVTCPPEDPTAVATALLRLRALTPCERKAMGRRGQHWITSRRSYAVLAERFLSAVQEKGRAGARNHPASGQT